MWLLGFRFAPYLIGACVLAGAVYGIYRAGYKSADEAWSLKWERHQGALMQANMERRNQLLRAMAERHNQEADLGQRFSEIEIPDTDTCTDSDWLRAHNDAVRAANGTP